MPLKADRAFPEFAAVAGIVVRRTIVDPVHHLNPVYPGRDVVAPGDDGHGEPLVVFGYLEAGRYAAINGAGAVVDRGVIGLFLAEELVGVGVVFLDRVLFRRL